MLNHHFKLVWRNLTRNLQFSLLNLFGLSAGLACTILICLWIADEMSFNRFNQNENNVYQVMQPSAYGNGAVENTPGLLASSLAKEFPEVEYAASVIPSSWFSNKGLFSVDNIHIRGNGQFVSKDFFHIFSCHFLQGNSSELFAAKNNMAISSELANELFGTTQGIIGKSIEWNEEGFDGNYLITGVFERFPSNSTIQCDAMFNYEQFLTQRPQLLQWNNNDPSTFLLLKKGTSLASFNKKISGFVQGKNANAKETLFAQRFSETYLYNHYENGVPSGGRITYVKLFSIIAAFILLIACINFMNLSTAKALQRLKEVGVQKVIGATRRSLIVQYLSESISMAFAALLLSVIFVMLLLPVFKQITGKEFVLPLNSGLIFAVLAITLLTGIVSGSYPALYLSGFRPVVILRGKIKNSASEIFVRKGLVVFQFVISVILIVSVTIIYQQMHLIQTVNLGYNRDHVIYFDKGGKPSGNKEDNKPGAVYKDLEILTQQVKTLPGVVNASNFRHSIVDRQGGTTDIVWPGKSPADQTAFTDIAAGYDFIETLGIEINEGRTYSRNFSDMDKVVLNEAAVKAMNLNNPVGKTITVWGVKKQIIGVTRDFHFQSLYENIKPCFFDLSMNQRVAKIIVRIRAGMDQATINRLAAFYKTRTGEPLDFKFLDEDYQALYVSEHRVAALSKYFAGIAILISCLGLFGLAAFTAQQRQKEIGVRKVIGASTTNLVLLLSKDFLVLVCISLLIGMPVASWSLIHWLQGFAYRISINPFVFVFTGVFVIAITLLTVSLQSVKAAIRNPVKSLRMQ